MKPLSAEYKEMFGKFIQHFEKELEAIDDQTLEKEVQQLTKIYQVTNNTKEKDINSSMMFE